MNKSSEMIAKKHLFYTLITVILISLSPSFAQQRTSLAHQSEELGKVRWYRDYDEAILAAKKDKKDIVVLFQEVPGCATCRNYGHNVLSNPLMVEALENSFIPLAIFNNKGGKDKKILEKFNEPSWNNPVVRIIDTKGKNLTKRIGNDYSAITLCKRLKETLLLRGTKVPKYLQLLEQELLSSQSNVIKEDYFKMYCFWTGEKQLGKLDGVMDVEAGFIHHNEVVKVTYNTQMLNTNALFRYATQQNFQNVNAKNNYKTATNDVHYYLKHSIYQYIPLSTLQKTKINSALGSQQSAKKLLSPTQQQWLSLIENNKIKNSVSFLTTNIEDAWTIMLDQIHNNTSAY